MSSLGTSEQILCAISGPEPSQKLTDIQGLNTGRRCDRRASCMIHEGRVLPLRRCHLCVDRKEARHPVQQRCVAVS